MARGADAADSTRRHYRITFAVLALGGVSSSILQSLVSPALVDMQRVLHTTVSGTAWLITAYLLSASVATPILGRLGDMFGKKRLLVLTYALLSVGVLVSAVASSLPLMLVGRVIQGVGGGIFPLAFGIIRDEFPRERVAGAIGMMAALLAGVGGGAGVVLAGPVVDAFDVHWLFWLPLIPLVTATVLIHFVIPESEIRVPGEVNWSGAALLAGGLVAILFTVSETTKWHWLSAKTIGAIGAGLVLLIFWVRSELRAREPLVDMAMMRIRGVWTTNVVTLVLGFGMYASFILIPRFVETPANTGYGFGASVGSAGFFLLPTTLMLLLVGSQTGRLQRRFGSKPPLLAGALVSAIAFLLLAFVHATPWEVYLTMLVMGTGTGLAFATTANLIIENVGPAQTGVATGMNGVTRTIGGSFGGAVTASLVAATVGASGYPTSHGYTQAFAVCALLLLIGVAVGVLIPRRGPKDIFAPHATGDLDTAVAVQVPDAPPLAVRP